MFLNALLLSETLERLERDLASVKDGDARAQVEQLLEVKRRHLSTLEELAAQHGAVATRT